MREKKNREIPDKISKAVEHGRSTKSIACNMAQPWIHSFKLTNLGMTTCTKLNPTELMS